jgi:hypothetical protein
MNLIVTQTQPIICQTRPDMGVSLSSGQGEAAFTTVAVNAAS